MSLEIGLMGPGVCVPLNGPTGISSVAAAAKGAAAGAAGAAGEQASQSTRASFNRLNLHSLNTDVLPCYSELSIRSKEKPAGGISPSRRERERWTSFIAWWVVEQYCNNTAIILQ